MTFPLSKPRDLQNLLENQQKSTKLVASSIIFWWLHQIITFPDRSGTKNRQKLSTIHASYSDFEISIKYSDPCFIFHNLNNYFASSTIQAIWNPDDVFLKPWLFHNKALQNIHQEYLKLFKINHEIKHPFIQILVLVLLFLCNPYVIPALKHSLRASKPPQWLLRFSSRI